MSATPMAEHRRRRSFSPDPTPRRVPPAAPTPRCALCGEPAAGLASINGVRYCHPDDLMARDCYSEAISARVSAEDHPLERLLGRA